MKELDRVAAVLKPSELMLDWINKHTVESDRLVLSEIQTDCTVILLPTFDDEDSAEAYLNEIYDDLFISELSSWHDDEALWPNNRSLDLFLQWFEVEFHSMVFDVAETVSHHRNDVTIQ